MFKSLLIDAYRWTTTPWRSLRHQYLKSAGQVPVGVLFFHRVDDHFPNDWTMPNQSFGELIVWMAEHFDLVDLQECQRRIQSGFNDRPTISITFDDGYADNCLKALPLLIEKNIPVTYFVTTHHVNTGEPFPHDAEAGQPLPINSIESLRAMAAAGIEIGAHTRNHANLGSINDPDTLYDEVITATRELESAIGQPIRYFAFPYGLHKNLNQYAFELLEQHGFLGACSAYGGWNGVGGNGFHLQRFHADPNLSRMKNWLTLDPRMKVQPAPNYRDLEYSQTSLLLPTKRQPSFPSLNINSSPLPNQETQLP